VRPRPLAFVALSLSVAAGAIIGGSGVASAAAPLLAKRPNAAQMRGLETAVRHTRGLKKRVILFLGISPLDSRWAVVDLIPKPARAKATAGGGGVAHQAYHQGPGGRWDAAIAPLGPVGKSLFRRPTFEIDYNGSGTDTKNVVVDTCDSGEATLNSSATFTWKGVWKHLTEDEIASGERKGYDSGSTVSGSQTTEAKNPCGTPPPTDDVCDGVEKVIPRTAFSLLPFLAARVTDTPEGFEETIIVNKPGDRLVPRASCKTSLDSVRWRETTETEVKLPVDSVFFLTDKTWNVTIDNPALPNHERVVEVPGFDGTDTVDWSGSVTMKRDGSYLIPQR
jgi:hypothetical protein